LASLLDEESHTSTHTHTSRQPATTSSSKRDRQKEPRAKKAVVALAAAWPSRLQRAKCIPISVLNANIIIIRLVYKNA